MGFLAHKSAFARGYYCNKILLYCLRISAPNFFFLVCDWVLCFGFFFLLVLIRIKKMLGASETNLSFADILSKRVKKKTWLWLRKDYLKKIFLL